MFEIRFCDALSALKEAQRRAGNRALDGYELSSALVEAQFKTAASTNAYQAATATTTPTAWWVKMAVAVAFLAIAFLAIVARYEWFGKCLDREDAAIVAAKVGALEERAAVAALERESLSLLIREDEVVVLSSGDAVYIAGRQFNVREDRAPARAFFGEVAAQGGERPCVAFVGPNAFGFSAERVGAFIDAEQPLRVIQ